MLLKTNAQKMLPHNACDTRNTKAGKLEYKSRRNFWNLKSKGSGIKAILTGCWSELLFLCVSISVVKSMRIRHRIRDINGTGRAGLYLLGLNSFYNWDCLYLSGWFLTPDCLYLVDLYLTRDCLYVADIYLTEIVCAWQLGKGCEPTT